MEQIESIESLLKKSLKTVEDVYDKFPWQDKNAYGNWLAQTFYFVSHSTRLLCASAARFSLSQHKLHQRYVEHLSEEKGHEVLAKNDLKNLGFSAEEFPELAPTAAFYQSQYFMIEHIHPSALFGYILVLEGISVSRGKQALALTEEAFGRKCSTFWHVHANEDEDHLPKALAQIEGMQGLEREAVIKSMIQSADMYVRILKTIELQSKQMPAETMTLAAAVG